MQKEEGIVKIPTHRSVDETVDKLRTILQSKAVTLFALVDHSDEAERTGLKMPPTKLLIFGSPKAGTPLMLTAPGAALDLPLKILVAEDLQGQVWISYNSADYLKSGTICHRICCQISLSWEHWRRRLESSSENCLPTSQSILVIGDVMTDIIVRPQGPLAKGSDTRARIVFRPGGSAANQAAWLASFGVEVDFVARDGAPDVESETARLKAAGVKPHLVGDGERETGRLVALIDPDGERSPHRPRRERGASIRRHPGCADRRRRAHPPLRLFVLRSLAAAGSPRRDGARGGQAGQRRSGVGGIPARSRGGEFSQLDARLPRSCSPMPRKRQSSPALATRRPSAPGLRRSPSARCRAWRGGLRSRCGRAALASRSATSRGDRHDRGGRRFRRRLPRRAPFGRGHSGCPRARRRGRGGRKPQRGSAVGRRRRRRPSGSSAARSKADLALL